MKSIIHISQGNSGRMFAASSSYYDIEGLYTDSFSSCNIIACIGKEQIVLVHADIQTNPIQIVKEIEWVKEPNDVHLIFRDQGEILLKRLLGIFQSKMPSKKFILNKMDDQYNGLLVSFNARENSEIHPQIEKIPFGQRPQNLLHHPQEQKFLAVQKIEQFIGLRAKNLTKKFRNKQLRIFDGCAWETLEDWHFSVDTSHDLTKKEMETFNKKDPFIVLSIKLNNILKENQKTISSIGKPDDLDITFYLEGHLNNFNYELLFKRNMQEMLNNAKHVPGYNPISFEDKDLKKQLIQLFNREDVVFEKTLNFFEQYKENAPMTEFKTNLLDEYQTFSSHYYKRKYYNDLYNQYNERLIEARRLREKAIKASQEQDYATATSLFLTVIHNTTHCCTKSNPDLANAYDNYGNALYQTGKFKDAKFFLETSLFLKKNHVDPKPLLSNIEKTRKILQECEQKLSKDTLLTFDYSFKASSLPTGSAHLHFDSPITGNNISALQEAIRKIIPGKNWKIPNNNTIWLELSDEEEAKKIVSHFNENGYEGIKLQHKVGTNAPILLIKDPDYNKLINIPTFENPFQKEESLTLQ